MKDSKIPQGTWHHCIPLASVLRSSKAKGCVGPTCIVQYFQGTSQNND